MSIRGVVANGVIVPIDPMPVNWKDGQSVIANECLEATSVALAQEVENFVKTISSLPTLELLPGEESELDRMMVEADRAAKELARNEMDQGP